MYIACGGGDGVVSGRWNLLIPATVAVIMRG